MKPLMEYTSYRIYIRDFYAERKERSGFTWRDFAKVAELGLYMSLWFG